MIRTTTTTEEEEEEEEEEEAIAIEIAMVVTATATATEDHHDRYRGQLLVNRVCAILVWRICTRKDWCRWMSGS